MSSSRGSFLGDRRPPPPHHHHLHRSILCCRNIHTLTVLKGQSVYVDINSVLKESYLFFSVARANIILKHMHFSRRLVIQ